MKENVSPVKPPNVVLLPVGWLRFVECAPNAPEEHAFCVDFPELISRTIAKGVSC